MARCIYTLAGAKCISLATTYTWARKMSGMMHAHAGWGDVCLLSACDGPRDLCLGAMGTMSSWNKTGWTADVPDCWLQLTTRPAGSKESLPIFSVRRLRESHSSSLGLAEIQQCARCWNKQHRKRPSLCDRVVEREYNFAWCMAARLHVCMVHYAQRVLWHGVTNPPLTSACQRAPSTLHACVRLFDVWCLNVENLF